MTIEWNKVVEVLQEHCPPKTEELEDILHWLYLEQGLSFREIEDLAKGQCSSTAVRNKLKELGLRQRKRGGPNNVKLIDIPEEDYKAMTYKQLAVKYKVNRTTIYRHIMKYKHKSNKVRD